MKTYTLRLTEEMYSSAESAAARDGVPLSIWLRYAIKMQLGKSRDKIIRSPRSQNDDTKDIS